MSSDINLNELILRILFSALVYLVIYCLGIIVGAVITNCNTSQLIQTEKRKVVEEFIDRNELFVNEIVNQLIRSEEQNRLNLKLINELEIKLKDSNNRVKTLTHEMTKCKNNYFNYENTLIHTKPGLIGKIKEIQELIDISADDKALSEEKVKEMDSNSIPGVLEAFKTLPQLKSSEAQNEEMSNRCEAADPECYKHYNNDIEEDIDMRVDSENNPQIMTVFKIFDTNSLSINICTKIRSQKLNNRSTHSPIKRMSTSSSSFEPKRRRILQLVTDNL